MYSSYLLADDLFAFDSDPNLNHGPLPLVSDIFAKHFSVAIEILSPKKRSFNITKETEKSFLIAVKNMTTHSNHPMEGYLQESIKLNNLLYRPCVDILKNERLKAGYCYLFCHCLAADIEKAIDFFYKNLKKTIQTGSSPKFSEEHYFKACKIGEIASDCYCLLPKDKKAKILKMHSLIQLIEKAADGIHLCPGLLDQIAKNQAALTNSKIYSYAKKAFGHLDSKKELPTLPALIKDEIEETKKTPVNFCSSTSSGIPTSLPIPIPTSLPKEPFLLSSPSSPEDQTCQEEKKTLLDMHFVL